MLRSESHRHRLSKNPKWLSREVNLAPSAS